MDRGSRACPRVLVLPGAKGGGMSVVWRLLSVAALVVSAGVLLFSIVTVRKELRVRPGLDLLRVIITVATTALMAGVLGVTTPEALMGAGLLGGLLAGVYEGLHLQVRFLGRQTFARRTVVGVGAWGAGVVLVQAAGVIGRVGLADFGLAVSFFGIGQVVGLLTGRWQSVLDAQRARAGRLAGAALVVLAVSAPFLPGGGPSAQAAHTSRQTEDLSTGDVQVTLRWSSLADLDLSVTDPAGETVSFTHRSSASGGQLDRDANYPCDTATTDPVENVFWPPGGAPRGAYRFAVTYRTGCGTEPAQSYELTVLFGGELVRRVEATIEPEEVVTLDLVYEGQGQLWGSGDVGVTAPVAAVDDDPENRLWDCATNPGHRVGFGDTAEDMARCFTFRYAIPARGIQSAVVYMAIEAPTGSLQDTDSVAVAVGEGFPGQCSLNGEMPGCVTVHGGFRGGERSLTVDLLNLACDPVFAGSGEMQEAVRAQLGTGVLHMILQDDTALHGARLALNEGPPALPCGVSTQVAPLGGGPAGRDAGVLSAGEGARTAAVGLGGAAFLLLTALVEGGGSVASLAGAWRGGGWRGWRDLALGALGGGGGAAAWRDPVLDLARGRAALALEGLPPGLRDAARAALLSRLDVQETDRLVAAVRRSVGPLDAAADPGEVLAGEGKAAGLLRGLPADVRERIEERVVAGLREERLQGLVESAAGEALMPASDLDAERDLAAGLRRSGRLESLFAGVPAEARAEAERRLVARLEAERLGRWVEKLRGVAAPPAAGGSVLEGADAQRVLAGLPDGLREQVESHVVAVLKGEMVERLAGEARHALERNRAMELLRTAFGLRDGDRADAVMNAVGASLDSTGGADVEQLVRQATGGGRAGLASLARSGTPVPPVDLTEHLAGEADLLAAARRVKDVEEVLRRAGQELRPRVEEALVQALDADRVGRVVRKAAEALSREGQAAADVVGAVTDVPGVKSLLDGLAETARGVAHRLLARRLEAERLEAAVARVSRAVALDRAEDSVRQAAQAGDIESAEGILAGLSSDERQAVVAAALGEGRRRPPSARATGGRPAAG